MNNNTKEVSRAFVRVRLRVAQEEPKTHKEILPFSDDYELMSDVFPLLEFNTPALMLEFFAKAPRFLSGEKRNRRPVRAYDLMEICFVEPVMPSNFLLVCPAEKVRAFSEHMEKRPQVFMFRSSPLALLSLHD